MEVDFVLTGDHPVPFYGEVTLKIPESNEAMKGDYGNFGIIRTLVLAKCDRAQFDYITQYVQTATVAYAKMQRLFE